MAVVFLVFTLIAQPQPLWIDGTLHYPEVMEIDRVHDPAFEPTGTLFTDDGHEVGDQVNFWSIDHSGEYPGFYLTSATCRYVGEDSYIFVEDAVWGVHYNQHDVDVYAAALQDSTPSGRGGIVKVDTDVFGPVPDAIDGDPRVFFFVLDIRDGFDPEQGGGYIAGFFSPYNQFTDMEAYLYYGGHSNEVEMLYIDCFPANAADAAYTSSHELVHLIQWGIKPFSGEDLWVIENQAQAGTYICGYPAFQVETFLEQGGVTPIRWTSFPFTSIDYVAGYGAGFLYYAYLYENYGGDTFLYNSLRVDETGMSGVLEAITEATGSTPDMDNILEDWMLANWIDDIDFGSGKYGYSSFRIADYDTVHPGNRLGLDFTAEITSTPFDDNCSMLSYQGKYYDLPGVLSGSFRSNAEGIGEFSAWFYNPSEEVLEKIETGTSGTAAVGLPREGNVLLFCNSLRGLELGVSAGMVVSNIDEFAVFPQPCKGVLYLQFQSEGGDVSLNVFDVTGGYVETIDFDAVEAGERTLSYTGAVSLASGVYFYRFTQGNNTRTGSFAVVR